MACWVVDSVKWSDEVTRWMFEHNHRRPSVSYVESNV